MYDKWKLTISGLGLFLTAFSLIVISGQSSIATAHDYSPAFKWVSNAATFEDRTADYADAINYAAGQITQTNLDIYVGSGGNQVHLQGRYPDTGNLAWVDPNSNGIYCFTNYGVSLTGNCNTTDHKPGFSYVYWNDGNDKSIPYAYRYYIANHESLHNFGFAHVPCSIASVMWTGCTSTYNYPQQHDIDDVNSRY